MFANFNKVDKLDPESFSLWMQILRRVPGSVLWLLEASTVDTEVGTGSRRCVLFVGATNRVRLEGGNSRIMLSGCFVYCFCIGRLGKAFSGILKQVRMSWTV